MDEEEVKVVVDTTKSVLRGFLSDKEMLPLIAKFAKEMYEAYIEAGFTAEQAIQLTCAGQKLK